MLCVISCAVFASCSNDDDESSDASIVGVWDGKCTDNWFEQVVVRFDSDGSFDSYAIRYEAGHKYILFTWGEYEVSGGKLRMLYSHDSGDVEHMYSPFEAPESFNISLSQDELKLTPVGDEYSYIFSRIAYNEDDWK